MAKEIFHQDQARDGLLRGINKVADAAKVTLGSRGKNVVLDEGFKVRITKDGVSVVKAIECEEPIENAGAQIIKEAATKTNDEAGDGTTTATVLAQAVVKEGLRAVVAGESPIEIKRGIDKGIQAALAHLRKQSREVKTHKEIEQVATISANGDAKIGKMIADAMEKVGRDGVITVSESKSMETKVDYTEGMEFDRGTLSHHFFKGNKKAGAIDFENCYVLVTDKSLGSLNEVVPILETVSKSSRPLLIIAKDIEGEVLATLLFNAARGTLKIAAVKAPSFGDDSKKRLEDISILTGGTLISEDRGYNLENMKMEDLGIAGRITITKDKTLIVKGNGKKEDLDSRIDQIRHEISETTSDYEREKLQDRLAKLTGGLAVLEVGAPSEVEMQEIKDRMVDALNATKAAVEEGIVAGGGVALVRCIEAVEQLKNSGALDNQGQILGVDILLKALVSPLFQIASNAGLEGSVVVQKVKEGKDDFGYNASTNSYEHLLKDGVVDPTKVVRSALQNGVSVGSMILTTDCVVTEKKKEGPEAPAPMPNMGGMM